MRKIFYILILIFICACIENDVSENPIILPPEQEKDLREFTILYTNDEHGWIDSSYFSLGAANMMGLWRNVEGFNGDDSYLILSGGDNWLGSPISDHFKGESVVDVMNAMEYDAATIGNHEFEYNIFNLYNRVEEANFPYLSANIRKKGTNNIPGFATPYIIKEVNGILVGIVGLTLRGTPNCTITEYVEDYEFLDYLPALNEIIPLVKSDGAELIILVAHVCYIELISMAPELTEMGITIVCGGHCHQEMIPEIVNTENGDIAIFQASEWFESYISAVITFDKNSGKITNFNLSRHLNEETNFDSNVHNVVKRWKSKMQ